jgi:hypothetical protein
MRRIILGVLVVAATAAAQQVTQQVVQDKLYFEAAGAMPGPAPMIATFGGAPSAVKGAPYSAEATTESVQFLADGNRIVNKSSNKSYRDSEGRTRVEITPGATGAWMPDMKPFSVTVIDDPVSGEHITLNNNNKQATRFPVKTDTTTTGAASGTGKSQSVTMVMRSSGDSAMPMPMPMPLPIPPQVAGGHATTAYVQSQAGGKMTVNAFSSSDMKLDVKKESLGKQVIEGVECTGTKETSTIAAGSVGNDRAIETVTERWYSPDLQLDVMTKTTDPRFGETTYSLGNIVRAEQPRSLFEVPADYKLEEPNLDHLKVMRDIKQQ